jgi:hypothetical protein
MTKEARKKKKISRKNLDTLMLPLTLREGEQALL